MLAPSGNNRSHWKEEQCLAQPESFVAEESDLEKTESATPRRLQKAREEGQIARSRELSTFALLAAGFFGVWGMSDSIGEHLQAMLRAAFTFDHAGAFETHRMMIGAGAASREGLYALLPILAVTGAAALLAPMAPGGWLVTSASGRRKNCSFKASIRSKILPDRISSTRRTV